MGTYVTNGEWDLLGRLGPRSSPLQTSNSFKTFHCINITFWGRISCICFASEPNNLKIFAKNLTLTSASPKSLRSVNISAFIDSCKFCISDSSLLSSHLALEYDISTSASKITLLENKIPTCWSAIFYKLNLIFNTWVNCKDLYIIFQWCLHSASLGQYLPHSLKIKLKIYKMSSKNCYWLSFGQKHLTSFLYRKIIWYGDL